MVPFRSPSPCVGCKKKPEIISSLFDAMRIKIKCQFDQPPKKNQSSSFASMSNTKSKKKNGKKNSYNNVTKQKSFGFCVRSSKPTENSVSRYMFEKRLSNGKNYTTNLKHNKSCENGIWGGSAAKANLFEDHPNVMYNSMIVGESTSRKRSVRSTTKKKVIPRSSNTLTDMISRTRKKGEFTHSRSLDTTPDGVNIIKKLDEKFKTIEETIIDKNFEENIDNDEMIVSAKKKFFNLNNSVQQKEDNTKITVFSNMKNSNKKEQENIINSEQSDDDDENDIEKFESLKTDFEIFYTSDYIAGIEEDMLKLELQLVLEKAFDLQECFHSTKKLLLVKYKKLKDNFNKYTQAYIQINKKNLKLQKEKEKAQISNSICTFINNHKIKNDKELASINKDECKLWKMLLTSYDKKKEQDAKRQKMSQIFLQSVSNKNLSSLDSVEKLLCERLIKKYTKKNDTTKRSGSSDQNVYNVNLGGKRDILYNTIQVPGTTKNSNPGSILKQNRHSNNEIKSKKMNSKIKNYFKCD